jgi:uncharacterized protein (TIGR02246 family)
MTTDPTAIVSDAFAELEKAWNNGDGAPWGERFTEDGHFVNIHGARVRGSEAIAKGHQAIFDTVYKGSTVQYSVLDADAITEDCLLGVVAARLDAPSGPLEGTHQSIITALFVRDGGGWKVRAFQNTLLAG